MATAQQAATVAAVSLFRLGAVHAALMDDVGTLRSRRFDGLPGGRSPGIPDPVHTEVVGREALRDDARAVEAFLAEVSLRAACLVEDTASTLRDHDLPVPFETAPEPSPAPEDDDTLPVLDLEDDAV